MEARSFGPGSGWLILAALLSAIAGTFSAIWGMQALGVSPGDAGQEVFGEASSWILGVLGTASLIVGGLQLLAGFGIWQRIQAARVIGLILGITALLLNLSFHHELDGWAISGLVVNLAIVVILAIEESEFR